MTPEQLEALRWQIIEGIVMGHVAAGFSKEQAIAMAAAWDRRVVVENPPT